MVLPNFFDRGLPDAFVSFDYVDFASGQSFVALYGTLTVDKKMLIRQTTPSYPTYQYVGTPNKPTAWETLWDFDFDTEFNVPTIIEGQTMANIPIGCYTIAAASSATVRATVTVRHWDGVTETDLVSNVSNVGTSINSSDGFVYDAVDLLIPRTKFKKGETLRLSVLVEGGGSSVVGTTKNYFFGHDPANSSYSTGGFTLNLRLRFDVPFDSKI